MAYMQAAYLGCKFYVMADGTMIDVGDRGVDKSAIEALQEQPWAIKHGGICRVVEYTEAHAVWLARQSAAHARERIVRLQAEAVR